MFRFIKEQLSKIYAHVTYKLAVLFNRKEVDEEVLSELERILIEADTGISTTRGLMLQLRDLVRRGTIAQGTQLKEALSQELKDLLHKYPYQNKNIIYMLVGVNGTGKTTCAAKLANYYKTHGKKVLLAAADTFRAAAADQLSVWADRIGIDCVKGAAEADPSSVIFTACQRFTSGGYDILIIDTAGRLQNKEHLMRELEKARKVISKQMPSTPVTTLLTIDALLGQNSLDQAKLFNQATQLNGIVLTKMDGTGKGGIVFAIADQIKVPIAYIAYGEQIDQMALFNPEAYINQILQ